MTVSSHNKHIKKLIKKGWSDKDIYNDIKKIYGIHYSLAQINKKRNTKLNDLIKPFKQDSEELLYPILYKGFPPRGLIKEKLEQIINYLIDAVKTIEDFPSEDVLIDLLLVFDEGLNNYKHDAFLYNLIYQFKKKSNQDLEDSRNIQILKTQIKDPFKHYFSLSNMDIKNISFIEDSPEFDHIIKEICRDNIITKKEREYLTVKASEYFIDPEKLELYLDNTFLGFETFKVFVDQICEDGVITDTEKDYINEKSKQYNVPSNLLKKMISSGLFSSQFSKKLSQDKDFYEIALIYLFAKTFNIRSIQKSLYNMITIKNVNQQFLEQFKNKKNDLFSLLMEEVELKAINIYKATNIFEFYSIINIEVMQFSNISQNNNTVKEYEDLDVEKEDCKTYHLDGYTFTINNVVQDFAPLFWSKTDGLHQNIYLNKSHPKYQLYSSDSFKQVLIALGRSSLSFSDNSGEIFYNKMKNYIELIKLYE